MNHHSKSGNVISSCSSDETSNCVRTAIATNNFLNRNDRLLLSHRSRHSTAGVTLSMAAAKNHIPSNATAALIAIVATSVFAATFFKEREQKQRELFREKCKSCNDSPSLSAMPKEKHCTTDRHRHQLQQLQKKNQQQSLMLATMPQMKTTARRTKNSNSSNKQEETDDDKDEELLSTANCDKETSSAKQQQQLYLRARQTIRKFEEDVTTHQQQLSDVYNVDWEVPLGTGSFGTVYYGTNKVTGTHVAIKKISKQYTNSTELALELEALLTIQQWGSHPNICSLLQSFMSEEYYYLILDLITGCEMFEHLVTQGAYSELDAARLIREVSSALSFLHSTGIAHCDLKPENLMLNSSTPSDAVIKLIDFGCARRFKRITVPSSVSSKSSSNNNNNSTIDDILLRGKNSTENVDVVDETSQLPNLTGRTLAYCPPEVLSGRAKTIDASCDCWALGVILYIMLVGVHPFDLSGQATDEEVASAVVSGVRPPLHNSPLTAHLSTSAIDLIDQLMQSDPEQRLTADEMLQHPWTRGETAKQNKIVDSDKKLSYFQMYKSGIAQTVIENMLTWSDEQNNDDVARRINLIERNFRSFDKNKRGYLTQKDFKGVRLPDGSEPDDQDSSRLSLSDFSDILAQNMQNRFFPKDETVYNEGEDGNAMYFINSGTVSVETSSGSVAKRGPGDFFGEGALLSRDNQRRSATVRCDTPVHAMQISREYFEKYMSKSDSDLMLTLREKDKIRKRNRAKMVLRSLPGLETMTYQRDDFVFKKGDDGDEMYLVDSGKIHILENDNHVFTANPGNVFGEYAILNGRRRNCTAICGTKAGCVLQKVHGNDFRRLVAQSPRIRVTLQDLCLRRDFKKAVVMRLKNEFPYDNPRAAFDAIKSDDSRWLGLDAVSRLMRELNPDYTDEEIQEIMSTINMMNSGVVTFEEFQKVFIADIKKSASV